MSATAVDAAARDIVFRDVSKFYGEVLGVNKVNLTIPPGITSLVGPNGSGKTTLMNLLTGLLRPSQGRVVVRGIPPSDPERMFRLVGYCTQFDSFPKGANGRSFVESYLRIHGRPAGETAALAAAAIERVGLTEAAGRRVAGYSKGMRQRIRLAQAIAHEPEVLILDEPLNGLDPMARAEMIRLFQDLADSGRSLVISSHILHEVDLISDQVILLDEGYVVAEGDIRGVRSEMAEHPLQILVRCDRPALLAARVFEEGGAMEARLVDDGGGVLIRTRDADTLYEQLNRIVLEAGLRVEALTPADEDVHAVYEYLIGGREGA